MEKRELKFDDDTSNKFWTITLRGKSHTVVYGRVGTSGRKLTKSFSSNATAKSSFDRLVRSKLAKGYTDANSTARARKVKTSTRSRELKWPKGYECFNEATLHLPMFTFGFAEFADDPYGGGDSCWLYWPLAMERRQPLVMTFFHDEYRMHPFFSSVGKFEKWQNAEAKRTDSDPAPPYEPDLNIDPESPGALYSRAMEAKKRRKTKTAIDLLTNAVAKLPEYTQALNELALLHRRQNRMALAKLFALRALVSPPAFGHFHQPLLNWLGKVGNPPKEFENNPIWTHRRELTWGGTAKDNSYEVMRDAIDVFLDRGHAPYGLTLMQAYCELMYQAPEPVRRRHKFNFEAWTNSQDTLIQEHLGVRRRIKFP